MTIIINVDNNGNPIIYALTTLTLSPQSTTLKVGETQQFTASGKDQYGNDMDLTGRNLIYNVHKA